MRLTHSETVATPIDTVWDHFMDLRRVGRCFPGAEVTDVRGNEFDGTMKAGIGLITLSFAGHGKLTVADEENHHAVIRSEGSDKRGLAKATIDIDLVLTEVDVSGRAGTRRRCSRTWMRKRNSTRNSACARATNCVRRSTARSETRYSWGSAKSSSKA